MVKKTLGCIGFSLVVITMITMISMMLYSQNHRKEEVIYEEKTIQITTKEPLYELNNPEDPPRQDDYVVHDDTTNDKANQLEDTISILAEEVEESRYIQRIPSGNTNRKKQLFRIITKRQHTLSRSQQKKQ